MEDNISTVGVSFSTMGDNSTVEVFSILKYYEFIKNLEIFSRAFSLRNQIDYSAGFKC